MVYFINIYELPDSVLSPFQILILLNFMTYLLLTVML